MKYFRLESHDIHEVCERSKIKKKILMVEGEHLLNTQMLRREDANSMSYSTENCLDENQILKTKRKRNIW